LAKGLEHTSPKTAQRVARHVLGQLVCLGDHTITGLLTAAGRQDRDWSADFRMYSRDRVQPEKLFHSVRNTLCRLSQGPVVVALDDTILRKSGTRTAGVKYRRDPMSPPFNVNFVRGQRFLQISQACPLPSGQARMVPVDWTHAPTPAKPRSSAPEEDQQAYRHACQQQALGRVAAQRLHELRQWMDENGEGSRRLWAVGDGSFTNSQILKNLPEETTFVGRIRSDAKLHFLPDAQPQAQGRRRVYGKPAPTPLELRQDESHPWHDLRVFYGGTERRLRAKRLRPLRWRTAGGTHDLQLVVIAPYAYRTTPKGKTLYRQPAYLICTDPEAPLEQVVQHYLWRWDIEVNFRDEKTLLGVGEAQVRKEASVQNVTAVAVAAYAMLLTAALTSARNHQQIDTLPTPKWQQRKPKRATTARLIQNLRHECLARAFHFSDFASTSSRDTKPQKSPLDLDSAFIYASRYS
jgi:hypothetical protein